MELPDLDEWAERIWGGVPSPEIMELCSQVSFEVMEAVSDPDLFFRHQRVDLVRLVIQHLLMQVAAEAIRLDRQSGPTFFGTILQVIKHRPRVQKLEPPLRSWIRRNDK